MAVRKPVSIIVEQTPVARPVQGRLVRASTTALVVETDGASTVVDRSAIGRITAVTPAAPTFAARGALIGAVAAVAIIALARSQSGQFDLMAGADVGYFAAVGALAGRGKSIRRVLYQCDHPQ